MYGIESLRDGRVLAFIQVLRQGLCIQLATGNMQLLSQVLCGCEKWIRE